VCFSFSFIRFARDGDWEGKWVGRLLFIFESGSREVSCLCD
jgi:hypothetical protein